MTGAPRSAGATDVPRVVDLLVGAFYDDPTWGPWAFPDADLRAEQHRQLWTLFVQGAMRHGWVWLADNEVATSVWIPPGRTELSDEQEASLESLLVGMLGAGAQRVLRALEMLELAHPRERPHYYLSLLGTDPGQRGHGYGLHLLGENLQHVDADGAAAYLEASNPINVPLYERHGFAVVGSLDLPDGGPTVHTMWRAPR